MSETLTHRPQALEDVKSGDLVTVFKSQGLGRPSKVKRVTKHQIILDNGDHYYRRNGRNRDGSVWYSPGFIAVGTSVEEINAERKDDQLRGLAAQELGVLKHLLTQETVIAKREVCDRAEATLRKLGEWKE